MTSVLSAATSSRGPLVIAVILNWNRWPDTVRCIESLLVQTGVELRLIIVDNGSVDDSIKQLRQRCSVAQLICNDSNLGFGGGCNIGIREALAQGADYIWLINNDAVASPSACASLVIAAQSDPAIGQVGSVIHDFDDHETMLAWGGGKVNPWLSRVRHLTTSTEDRDLDFITAASTLIPRHVCETVGLFDEHFFLYWEDVDLSFRIRAAGYLLAVAPQSQVLHAESSSLGKKNPQLDFYYARSAAIFFEKHFRLGSFLASIGMLCRCAKRLSRLEVQRFKAVVNGHFNI